jgi:hypothetical protein
MGGRILPWLIVLCAANPGTGPPAKSAEFAHDQRYELTPVFSIKRHADKRGYAHRLDNPGVLDGPGFQGHGSNGASTGLDVDAKGNAYWAVDMTYPVVRRWDVKTGMVTTIAGSACGHLDGPLHRARFGGWGYNSNSLICVSADAKHIFLTEPYKNGLWRHLDMEAGVVRSLEGPRGVFVIAKDKSGEIRAFRTDGQQPPDCNGYKKLDVATFQHEFKGRKIHYIGYINGRALDVENAKFYWHARNAPFVADLKTGQTRCLTPAGPNPRRADTTGPFEGMAWHCPTDMSISRGGRYLYMGGGDSFSFYRLDLQRREIDRFARFDDGTYGWREGHEKDPGHVIVNWPGAPHWAADGSAGWGTAGGMFRIVPTQSVDQP